MSINQIKLWDFKLSDVAAGIQWFFYAPGLSRNKPDCALCSDTIPPGGANRWQGR
jgi:hypothetical protein